MDEALCYQFDLKCSNIAFPPNLATCLQSNQSGIFPSLRFNVNIAQESLTPKVLFFDKHLCLTIFDFLNLKSLFDWYMSTLL